MKAIHRRITTIIALLVALVFYSFEAHHPAPLALHGADPQFFYTPSETSLQDTVIESIRQAKSSIAIAIYSLRDKKIIRALNDQAKAGVKVQLVCDADASKDVEKWLDPKIQLTLRNNTGLMHNKWIVIDRSVCWLGSANITRDALTSHFNLMEQMHCPQVAQHLGNKIADISRDQHQAPTPPLHFAINGKRSSLHFLPDDSRACNTIKSLMNEAKKTIRVAMYTFTRKDFAECLAAAKKRGVKVEVAIDASSSKGTSKKVVELLKKSKIKTYFNSGNELLHHKFVWIDDQILAHGSANWTIAAFKQNDDCIMIHYDLTTAQNAILGKAWRDIVAQSP